MVKPCPKTRAVQRRRLGSRRSTRSGTRRRNNAASSNGNGGAGANGDGSGGTGDGSGANGDGSDNGGNGNGESDNGKSGNGSDNGGNGNVSDNGGNGNGESDNGESGNGSDNGGNGNGGDGNAESGNGSDNGANGNGSDNGGNGNGESGNGGGGDNGANGGSNGGSNFSIGGCINMSISNTLNEDNIRNRLRPRRVRVQYTKEVEINLDLDLEEADFEYGYEDGNDDDSDYEGCGGKRQRGTVKEKEKTSKRRRIPSGPALPEMEASVLFSRKMREYLCNEVVRAVENSVWIFDDVALSELAAKPKNTDCTNSSIEGLDDIESGREPSIGVDKDGDALFMFLPGIIGPVWQAGFVKAAGKVVTNRKEEDFEKLSKDVRHRHQPTDANDVTSKKATMHIGVWQTMYGDVMTARACTESGPAQCDTYHFIRDPSVERINWLLGEALRLTDPIAHYRLTQSMTHLRPDLKHFWAGTRAPRVNAMNVLVANHQIAPHHDKRDIPYGWAPMCCFGTFTKGGRFCLPDLGIMLPYRPGDILLICSQALEHFVETWASDPADPRYAFLQFTHQKVFELGLEGFKNFHNNRELDGELAAEMVSSRWPHLPPMCKGNGHHMKMDEEELELQKEEGKKWLADKERKGRKKMKLEVNTEMKTEEMMKLEYH